MRHRRDREPTVHASATCRNCGAAVTDNYCAHCGQETRLHVPTAFEFVHEFISHYVALEGKLWQTLKLLVLRPGALTAAYLAGRRQRYVLPLRVFLTFSILFFAVLKYAGHMEPRTGPQGGPVAQENVHLQTLWGTRFPSVLQRVDRFNALPTEQKIQLATSGFFAYVPYAVFLLMPLFALYLKLLYLGSGRRYGEHLLFALHTNAFAYFALAWAVLLPWGPVRMALGAWLLVYLPLAMQHVYGGRKSATTLRWLVLGTLHMISIAVAIASALSYALLHE